MRPVSWPLCSRLLPRFRNPSCQQLQSFSRSTPRCSPTPQTRSHPLPTLFSQPTVNQVLHLADRLRAEQCERAAIGILSSAAIGPLEWHTVTALYRLPPSIAHNEAYCPLYNAAAAALQDRLGDLDAAWLSQQLSRDLRNLPFAALKQLLSDARTRVVSENTAFYTVAAWLRRHKGATPEQERALAYRLRLPHITRLYLSSVVPRSDWLMHHISAADLMHAAAFAGTSDAARQAVVDDEAQLQVAPCASWKLPRRPPSKFSDAQVTVEWEVGLGEVRELHERALLATSAPAFIDSPAYVHQGLQWGIRLETQNKGGEMRYNAYVAAIRPPGTRPPLAVSAQISIWTRKLATGFSLWTFLGTSVALGEDNVFGSGVRGLEWDEAAWRAGGLVEENGKIKVCASIKDVV